MPSAFAGMLTTLSGARLSEWIAEAADAGLHGDFAAVTAGLTTDRRSGPVEGAANRIKMLKRQMFGRAGVRASTETRPAFLTRCRWLMR